MKLRLLQRNIKRKETYYNSSALLRNFHRGVRGGYGAGYRQLAKNDNFTGGYGEGTGGGDIVDRL